MERQNVTKDETSGQWVPFGWQGISLTVPADWQLVVTDGDRTKGYVRLVDDAAVRLEMRWEDEKGETDVNRVVADCAAELKKKAARQKADLNLQRRINVASFPEAERKAECYSWDGDVRVVAMVSRCMTCRRVTHLQVLGRPDEKLRAAAKRIFYSLKDHPDQERDLWAFYDLRFEVPPDFKLVKPDLKTGCIAMRFERRSDALEVSRLSLAHVVLQNTALERWLRDYAAKTLKPFSVALERGTMRGHEAVGLSGRSLLIRDLLGPLRGRRTMRMIAWLCDRNDKIFVCSWASRKARHEDFAALVARIACHEETQES